MRYRETMSIARPSSEWARQVVEYYSRGVICAGEVWNQFADHATSNTFPQLMAQLTPELERYFRGVILDYDPAACRSDRERQALKWPSEYYQTKG